MLTTWQYRIKDGGKKAEPLVSMSRAVNHVWNRCKEEQIQVLEESETKAYVDKKTGAERTVRNYLSSFELDEVFSGRSKELGLHSQTIQAVTKEYATRVRQFGKTLRWRGRKSPGWVPFKASGVKISEDRITHNKKTFRFWNSRPLPADAKIKTGSFTQDARGRWYVSITFETEMLSYEHGEAVLGGDLGVKTLLSLSDGSKVERPNLRKELVEKVRKVEKQRKVARRQQSRTKKFGRRLPKSKQLRTIHAKAANTRKDYLHKESTKLIERSELLVVGDVPCKLMNRSKTLAGISLDSGIGMLKEMLRYKAVRAGAAFQVFSERDSTQTCSSCGWKHPNERRIGLGVRDWCCPKCEAVHDRDTNAAKNILASYQHHLRLGHETPTPCAKRPEALCAS